MRKWLDDDIFMYSIHNESNSVVAERFTGTLKGLIYKRMTANNKKYYLGYLIKLAGEYNNTYHHSIDKKPIDVDYFALIIEIKTNSKSPRFKAGDVVGDKKYF